MYSTKKKKKKQTFGKYARWAAYLYTSFPTVDRFKEDLFRIYTSPVFNLILFLELSKLDFWLGDLMTH